MAKALRERDIEKYGTDKLMEVGAEVRKVKWIGRRGAPDRLCMHKLLTVWIEYKAPGELPEAHQYREHERMRKQGQEVLVIDSFEQVNELIERIKCPKFFR